MPQFPFRHVCWKAPRLLQVRVHLFSFPFLSLTWGQCDRSSFKMELPYDLAVPPLGDSQRSWKEGLKDILAQPRSCERALTKY